MLGWVPGIITMVMCCILFWFTSITMHKYIMKYPQIKDICESIVWIPNERGRLTTPGDFGYYIFGQSKAAYVFSGFMLLANNIMLIGFHILTGAKVLNTLSDHSMCTAVFSVIVAIIGIIISMPRTLHHVSLMSMFSCKSYALQVSYLC